MHVMHGMYVMYICMYVCIYVCMYVCLHVCIYIYTHTYTLQTYVPAKTYLQLYTCIHVPRYAKMCLYKSMCMRVYVYMYTVVIQYVIWYYMHVVFMYTDMLPQPWPFCNTTASWNAKLDVCSSHLFLRVLGTQAIVWLGRRQILLSGGFLWMCKRIWRIYCALLWFSLSLSCLFLQMAQDEARYPEAIGLLFWFLHDFCQSTRFLAIQTT